MRNKLIALFLPLVITTKAFSAPAGSACDWVDQEALAALGLANAVPKVTSQEASAQKVDECTFAAPNAPIPSLKVSVKPNTDIGVLKPVCQWTDFPQSDMGFCFMKVGDSFVSLTLMTEPSSASNMQSTLSTQAERLLNEHLDTASK